ncbi:hypothetical protein ACQEU5_21990 [Marinactinospora thermotolerans]|uniref:hypothetical protein n=1 Tax=Marinactinospora thermotolerans TaxID=531310 RepID=UPI003D909E64
MDRAASRPPGRLGRVGSADTRLIVLRGGSGAGESAIAMEIHRRHGSLAALVGQDGVRGLVLKERDGADGAHIEMVSVVAGRAMGRGYRVVVEGVLAAGRCWGCSRIRPDATAASPACSA